MGVAGHGTARAPGDIALKGRCMIRLSFAAGVSALALCICASAPAAAQETRDPPTINYGTWGVDPAGIDQAVDPGDDFDAYVNGKWVRENPIPPEYTRFGAFNILAEKSTSDVEALVADLVKSDPAPGTPARRIVDAYQTYLDTAAIDAAGMAPAQPWLRPIFAAQDLGELSALFSQAGYPSLIAASVTVDAKDPKRYIVTVGFDGTGLPDRDNYLVDNERNREIQAKYKAYLAFLLDQAGYYDAAGMAEQVYAFEHKVAEIEWARTSMRNRDITYNQLTRAELLKLAGDYPLAAQLAASGFAGQRQFLMPQLPPTAAEAKELGLSEQILSGIGGGTPAMMELLTETPLPVLKAFMAAQFLNANAPVLPSAIDNASFDFFGRLLGGQVEQRPRWKRAIAATEGMLGEQLGALYVERYFPPSSKAAMDDLVKNLRLAMADSLRENTWMSPETKRQAVAKLDAFTPKIGYPAEFEQYRGLDIVAGDALGNRMRTAAWQLADNRAKLGQPVDKTEWGMLPQTVNAYYNSVFNEIAFPAGILQPPFFNPSADPAVNYGGIGAVIGHEMGHGFDDQGSKSDANGVLRDWWQPADLAKFTALGDRLVAQYDAFCPYDDGKTCMNGRLSLGENIGDVGGLSLAYRAYRKSLNGQEAPVIDGLTGDQRFFLAWAQVWRSQTREAAGRQRLLTGPHSLEQFRVNGPVRNMDAWYKAFNVTSDDAMYLPPEQRVQIW